MICGSPTIRGTDDSARGKLGLALGVLVQDPATGMWFDDGTGTPVDLPAPPPDSPANTTLPVQSSQPSDWLTAITGALPKVASFLTAEQLAQVNVNRAKAGQPPLQTSQYAPQVGVGLDSQTKTFITYGGIGVAALILFSKLRKRRR